jgi:hypothetical protein
MAATPSARETRRKADAGIDRHWLEYPDGIPVEAWSRDHNSTLLYAETRAVDHDGWLSPTDPHMRVSRLYPTRLHNGVEIHGHTDYDCLADAQAAGFLVYDPDEVPEAAATASRVGFGRVRFTDDGWTYVHALRRKRAEKGLFP